MAWDVSADMDRFTEALQWFLDRLPLTQDEYEQIDAETRKRAWTVAGVAQLRIVSDTHASITKAIETGQTLAEWKSEAAPALDEAWGGTVKNPAHRLETIFRSNTQTAYAAGREKLASHPSVKRLRPYARFDSIVDARTTDECRELNGIVLPQDDPFWSKNTPPRHHNCRSGKITLTAEQAREEGITSEPPETDTPDGWGSRPDVGDWNPDLDDVPDELRDIFSTKV